MSLFRIGVLPSAGGLGIGLALCATAGAGPAVAGAPTAPDTPLNLRGTYAAALAAEPGDQLMSPFFAVDWSVELAGSSVHDGSGSRFSLLLTPTLTASHVDSRASYVFSASADLERTATESRLSGLRGSFAGSYRIDSLLSLGAEAELSLSQQDAGSPGLASNVATAPVGVTGTAQVSATRRLGRFDLTLSANGERDVNGDTTLTDRSTTSNADENRTLLGLGLRIGHPLTPIISAYAELNGAWDRYDAPSPTYLVALDGATYTARAGLVGKWGEVAEAQASVGYGLRTYNATTLSPVNAMLYDASLTFNPSRTLALTGGFSSEIDPPGTNGSGTAEVIYAATAGANYKVNDWVALRASAGWHHGWFAATNNADDGYSFGTGIDYAPTRHVKLSADYLFEHSAVTPDPADDSHTVTVGLTVLR